MADSLKVLGQTALAGSVLTDVYTVPTSTSATISTITVCNRGTGSTSFRISVAKAGAADSSAQYIYYDQAIDGNSSFTVTIGMTLGAGDVIRSYTTGASVSVNIFGVEIS